MVSFSGFRFSFPFVFHLFSLLWFCISLLLWFSTREVQGLNDRVIDEAKAATNKILSTRNMRDLRKYCEYGAALRG